MTNPLTLCFYFTSDMLDFIERKLGIEDHSPWVKKGRLTRLIHWLGSWSATLELMTDKEAMESLREAMQDAREGRFLTYKEVFVEES